MIPPIELQILKFCLRLLHAHARADHAIASAAGHGRPRDATAPLESPLKKPAQPQRTWKSRIPTPARRGAGLYYPSRDGCAFLAQECEGRLVPVGLHADAAVANRSTTGCGVAETHLLLDHAVAKLVGRDGLRRWVRRMGRCGAQPEREPHRRFRLYTLLRGEPEARVAWPDAGVFCSVSKGHRKVFYLEQDPRHDQECRGGLRRRSAAVTPLSPR